MKKIMKQATLISTLLGSLIITGCQGISMPSTSSNSSDGTSSVFSSSENNQSSSHENEYGVTVIKEENDTVPDEGITFTVESLNKEFCLKGRGLYATDTDTIIIAPLYNLYLADANKDGCLDFIFTTTSGRSYDNAGVWVGVYDYKNSQMLYELNDPNEFDYRIHFSAPSFIIEKTNTDYWNSDNFLETGRLVGKGILDYSGEKVTTKWENFLNIDSCNFNITLAGKDRTPVPLKTTGDNNIFIVEHASVDNAYCITTNVTRNSGKYDDLTSDLPVGYRLNGDYFLVQSIASNIQDNVIIYLDSAYLEYNKKTSAVVEVCVSNFIYNIVFEFDTYEYDANHATLIGTLGWTFASSDIVEFSYEYIPGPYNNPYSEEEFPFTCVSVGSGRGKAKEIYRMLEGLVVEIDPALVKTTTHLVHFFFKTSDNKYTFTRQNPFIQINDSYYIIIYAQYYANAINTTKEYVRFRDGHSEIRVEPVNPGLTPQVIQNATSILFKQWSNYPSEALEDYKNNASYTFTIANNLFYIIDAKTMVMGSSKYEVASEADFSSLFPVA